MKTDTAKTLDFKEYEFNKRQSKHIYELSQDMRFVGIFLNVMGWLTLLLGSLQEWQDNDYIWVFHNFLVGSFTVFIAISTTKAANSFKLIEMHQGSDIKNLMDAFRSIRSLYHFQFWFLVLIIGYWLVVIILETLPIN